MQHRAILRATKTGTITHTQARDAARVAKGEKMATRAASTKVVRSASSFGFGFGPAMGDPKAATSVRVRKQPTKKRAAGRSVRDSKSGAR